MKMFVSGLKVGDRFIVDYSAVYRGIRTILDIQPASHKLEEGLDITYKLESGSTDVAFLTHHREVTMVMPEVKPVLEDFPHPLSGQLDEIMQEANKLQESCDGLKCLLASGEKTISHGSVLLDADMVRVGLRKQINAHRNRIYELVVGLGDLNAVVSK